MIIKPPGLTCDKCGGFIFRGEEIEQNYQKLHENCAIECSSCGDKPSEIAECDSCGDKLCDSCGEFTSCDVCDQYQCESCRCSTFECAECDNIYHSQDGETRDNRELCPDCCADYDNLAAEAAAEAEAERAAEEAAEEERRKQEELPF